MGDKARPFQVTRRTWFKMFAEEWLDGTMRFQLSHEQRAIWADLLALAARSRYPGIICSGETNGEYTPYPSGWIARRLNYSARKFRQVLALFEQQDRISNENGVIKILSWGKYQSEYKRQLPYRSTNQGSEVTEKLLVEAEADGDGETEGEAQSDGQSDGDAAEQRKAARTIRAAGHPPSLSQPDGTDGLADGLAQNPFPVPPPDGPHPPTGSKGKKSKGKVLISRFEGFCRLCKEVIAPGETVRWMGEKQSAHEACYAAKRGVPPEDPQVPVKAHPVGATERGLGLDDDAELASLTAWMREKAAKEGVTV
jgi:hypothetical protein